MKAKASLKTVKPAFDTEKMLVSFLNSQIRELGPESGVLYARRCFEQWTSTHTYDFCLESMKRTMVPIMLGHVSDATSERARSRHPLSKKVAVAYLDGWVPFFGKDALSPIRKRLDLPEPDAEDVSCLAPSQ